MYSYKIKESLRQLRTWIDTQNWLITTTSYVNCSKGIDFDEIMVAVHNVDIDSVIKTIKSKDFNDMSLKFLDFEKVTWNNNTYFIDFKFLG